VPELFLLCEYPTLNGGERSMLSTLDFIRAAGLTPVALVPEEGPLAEALAAKGVEVLPFQCRAADGVRFAADMLRYKLENILSRRRPALLHANSLAMGRLSGPVAARLGLPSIAHLRDIVGISARAAADLNCHRRLLAVSRAVAEYHAAGGLAAEKIHVLHNGVDLDEFRPRPASGYLHAELGLGNSPRPLGEGQGVRAKVAATCPHPSPLPAGEATSIESSPKLIGAIGQIGPRKGQDILLSAAARVFNNDVDAHLLIIGERNSEKDESRRFERLLHEKASEGELAGRVHFLGRRDDVPRLLNELTLLVHPARQEPLGRVLLEAAASGTAVVAAAVGGTAEIFPLHARAARLVPPNDACTLSAAMLELLANDSERCRLGAAARRRAETAFALAPAAKKLVEHYFAVIS
jgi:glycosyltransferase involved in cell wall biosynthesis